MSISILNLRTFGIGSKPESLEPGQICFNLTEKRIFVGDGSDYITSFDGVSLPGKPGLGWYEMPMDADGLSDFFIQNPASLGDNPLNGQVLSWSTSLNHPVWTTITPGGPTAGAVYQTTNAAVAAASGTTVTEKINAALGIVPTSICAAIVSGNPGDEYQGLYYFVNDFWVFAANYAGPTATQVPYSGINSGLVSNNVQGAIDEVNNKALEASIDAENALNTANAANATAGNALTLAQQALPKTGGTLTGNITLNGQSAVRFADADSSHWVALRGPATVTNDVTWTLPAEDGASGEVLSTDGLGNLEWVPVVQDIVQTKQVIDKNITLATGYNGLSVGPVSVAPGYTVTVPPGATWMIL